MYELRPSHILAIGLVIFSSTAAFAQSRRGPSCEPNVVDRARYGTCYLVKPGTCRCEVVGSPDSRAARARDGLAPAAAAASGSQAFGSASPTAGPGTALGNPGNDKPVGKAGEFPSGPPSAWGSVPPGSRGRSDGSKSSG